MLSLHMTSERVGELFLLYKSEEEKTNLPFPTSCPFFTLESFGKGVPIAI
jgi:hypothetical protein